MKYAITLSFNNEGQNKVNSLRKVLLENGVRNGAYEVNHITLSDIETDDIGEVASIIRIIEKIAKKQKQFTLTLASVGSFMTSENVVFLNAIMTDKLELVHKMANKMLSRYKRDAYYEPNKWVPHSTIAIKLSDAELTKAFKLLKSNNILPLSVIVDKIDIVQHDIKTNKQIATFDLC